jgi:IMP dehydrogenase
MKSTPRGPKSAQTWDSLFYKAADDFFISCEGLALTYDDVSLATLYSEILPKEANYDTLLAPGLHLHLPVVSADMDTVTESRMAISLALHGGLGLIHYNMPPKQQLSEVSRVKNHVHGLIREPIKVHPDQKIGDVLSLIEEKKFTFSTFPVVDEFGHLLGLLPGHCVRARFAARNVSEAMVSRPSVLTIRENELGGDPIARADRFFTDNIGIHKLLVVDEEDRLKGLFTLSDIERISQERSLQTKPARDEKFRLICGAAISPPRLPDGSLDQDSLLAHVGAMVERGLDAVAVSTAHGHTRGVGECVKAVRAEFPNLPIIAGNVTSGAGVEFLAECGANTVKVGQGPGSICTTRVVAGVGIPQLTALYVCSKAAENCNVTLLADGGITKSGDIVKALTLSHAVICGSLLAGCPEAPGQIMEINGKFYKQYRGMGSHAAMKAGSAARYGHGKEINRKSAAEGIEALKEVSAPVDTVLAQLAGGLQSGMGYLGASNLGELRGHARYTRITSSGLRESAPHDVIEVKTGDAL